LGGGIVAPVGSCRRMPSTAHTPADKTATPLYHLSRVRQGLRNNDPALGDVTQPPSNMRVHPIEHYIGRFYSALPPRPKLLIAANWACITRASRLLRSLTMSGTHSRRDFLRLVALGVSAVSLATPGARVLAASDAAAQVRTTPTPPAAAPQVQPTPRPTPPPISTPGGPVWLQALRSLTLWSGPDDAAEPLGTAARWDYFAIARPQVGGR